MTERVRIFDTTLRDGEQSPGCSMNLGEKLKLARKLEELGVDIIEAGFPIASDGDFAAVQAVAKNCREVTVAALCRTSAADVERAAEALREAERPRGSLAPADDPAPSPQREDENGRCFEGR